MMANNPLKAIAENWYGSLTENRAKKLDRLWRRFKEACEPNQKDMFGDEARRQGGE